MGIPATGAATLPGEWSGLTAEQKRERILAAAAELFNREGLDASMPAVAAAAGAGIASVYRQFPSKHDLLAALVTRRIDQLADATRAALARPGPRWEALTEMLHAVVDGQRGDDFVGEAWAQMQDDPGVVAATERTMALLEQLLAGARAEGRLRADATAWDLRLVLSATRAADQLGPDGRPRMLALLIDALDGRRGESAPGV